MQVRKLLAQREYGIRPYPPYNEKHVEIRKTRVKTGEQISFILTEDEAIERFGEHDCWLAFHSEGTFDNPVNGEHVFVICIDKNGWGDNND